MYYVYLLRLSNNFIYTGSSPNLKDRIRKHQDGKCKSTKGLRPIRIIWYCAFTDRTLAVEFEQYLKSGSGQAFRNKHLL